MHLAPLFAVLDWQTFFFTMFALVACVFGLGVLFSKNIVRMAFYLIISLGAVAGLFFIAGAEFVGAMQLMIYVGGTLVLLIFGVMLTAQESFVNMKTRGGDWVLAAGIGGSLLVLLLITAFQVKDWSTPRENLDEISIADSKAETPIGAAVVGVRVDHLDEPDAARRASMSGYLLPFEIVSIHLLVVLIGAAYLARTKLRVAGAVAPAPRVERKRPLAVTGGLISGIIANIVVAGICLFGASKINFELDEHLGVQMPEVSFYAIGALFLFSAVFLFSVAAWQKWGVFAIVLSTLAQTAIIGVSDAGWLIAGGFFVIAIAPVAMLIALICKGGEKSVWNMLE